MYEVWVFDVESGKELRRQNVPASVSLIHLSPDSKVAAFGTADGIATWDVDTGAFRTFAGLTARPTSAVFNKDGRFVMATGHDRSLSLWDVGAGLLSVEPGLPGQGNSIGLAPDGKRVAAGGAGGGAGLWNLPPVAVPAPDTNEFVALRRLTGFNGHLEDAVFTADGRRVVACGADRTVRAWDAATGEQVLRFAVPANPRGLAVLSGDRLVVTFTATGEVRTYDLKDGKPLREFPHDRGVVSAAAMPDGKRFLTCGHGQAVHLWDADTGEEVGRFELGETAHGLAACPDGKRFVVACANRQNPKAATVRSTRSRRRGRTSWRRPSRGRPRA